MQDRIDGTRDFGEESFDSPPGLDVLHLHGRVLHVVGAGRQQRPADALVAGQLAAADGVDGHAGGVGRILDAQPQLQVQRHAAEAPALHPQEADLVVVLPGDVVGRADVDLVVVERLVQLRLDGLGLGDLLAGRAGCG